jgi:protease-4
MVALEIDSPGGAPFEAERINATIDYYREKTKIPTYAFIGNTGASAAYLIALHADKIFAGRFSLVGSIGAIIETWDFHRLMEKADIGQRVYASGIHKDMLNPFAAMKPESDHKAQDMVDQMAGTFEKEFRRVRGDKLKGGVDYATGEVWDGEHALALGVVDALDSIENVVRREYGPDMKIRDFGPCDTVKSPFKMLGQAVFDNLLAVFKEAAIGFLAQQAPARAHSRQIQ